MKFLGLRFEEHDTNITFTDGRNVRYCATERLFGIKHHGFDNGWQWQDVINDWGVRIEELDGIAIITDGITFEDGELFRELETNFPCKFFAIDHHYAHVLSLWPIEIPRKNFVFDGWGNNERSYSSFVGKELVDAHSVHDCGSIGIAMGNVGRAVGLKADEHGLDLAGKVMGLQSYGTVDRQYLRYLKQYTIKDIKEIWDFESWPRQWHWDVDFDINWLRTVHEYTGDILAQLMRSNEPIGYSGGVAQNSVFNSKIARKGKVIIPPHANDCGLSLGAVEFLRQFYDADEFDNSGFPFWQDDEAPESEISSSSLDRTAEALAAGKIVAYYQGHGEIGPRALGNRSILMNARDKDAKEKINTRVKHRENFRPFGAAVLREDVKKYFLSEMDVPYMNVCCDVRDKELTSVTHVDGSGRIQTVKEDTPLRRLMERYKEITGDSVLLNTSLNIGGKPIAGKAWEAKELFSKKEIDVLVVGDEIVEQ